MGVLPVSYSSTNSLDIANNFVDYLEHRLQTKRALVSKKHFAQLRYLAGCKVLVSKSDLAKMGPLVSLRDHNYADLVPIIRERINLCLIPDNWAQLFSQHIDESEED